MEATRLWLFVLAVSDQKFQMSSSSLEYAPSPSPNPNIKARRIQEVAAPFLTWVAEPHFNLCYEHFPKSFLHSQSSLVQSISRTIFRERTQPVMDRPHGEFTTIDRLDRPSAYFAAKVPLSLLNLISSSNLAYRSNEDTIAMAMNEIRNREILSSTLQRSTLVTFRFIPPKNRSRSSSQSVARSNVWSWA